MHFLLKIKDPDPSVINGDAIECVRDSPDPPYRTAFWKKKNISRIKNIINLNSGNYNDKTVDNGNEWDRDSISQNSPQTIQHGWLGLAFESGWKNRIYKLNVHGHQKNFVITSGNSELHPENITEFTGIHWFHYFQLLCVWFMRQITEIQANLFTYKKKKCFEYDMYSIICN